MKKSTPLQKAIYITNLVKSVSKSLEYALNIVVWYTITDSEQEAVENLIKTNWSFQKEK